MSDVRFDRPRTHCKAKAYPTSNPASSSTRSDARSSYDPLRLGDKAAGVSLFGLELVLLACSSNAIPPRSSVDDEDPLREGDNVAAVHGSDV